MVSEWFTDKSDVEIWISKHDWHKVYEKKDDLGELLEQMYFLPTGVLTIYYYKGSIKYETRDSITCSCND